MVFFARGNQSLTEEHDTLSKRYSNLPNHIQQLLLVLAVPGFAASKEFLIKLLDKLEFKDSSGIPLSRYLSGRLINELQEKQLIFIEHEKLKIHPLILETLSKVALQNGQFSKIFAGAQQELNESNDKVHNITKYKGGPFLANELRLALYQNNIKKVRLILGIVSPFNDLSYEQAYNLLNIAALPIDPSWLEQLDEEVRFYVLSPLLRSGAVKLWNISEYFQLWQQWFASKEDFSEYPISLSQLAASQALQRGELQQAENYLTDDFSVKGQQLQGWLKFLQGDYEDAIKFFESSLTTQRKLTKKRNIYVQGLPGIFFLLSLLKKSDTDSAYRLEREVKMAEKLDLEDTFYPSMRLLYEVSMVQRGRQSFAQSNWLKQGSWAETPWLDLFRLIALVWLGEKPSSEQKKKLPLFCQQATAAGLHWYARESAYVLQNLGMNEDLPDNFITIDNDATWQPLVDLIKPKENWERALAALSQVGSMGSTGSHEVENERRFIWRVVDDDKFYSLEPREQKISKNGKWSKGRPIALKKLYNFMDEYSWLTEQDKKILQHIDVQHSHNFSGYPQTTYNLSSSAILDAIGHPLIFRADKPEISVEVIKHEPVLEIIKQQDDLLIKLSPSPVMIADDAYNIPVCEWEGLQKLRITEFKPAHFNVARILGANGLQVPSEAKEQVLESISAIAPLLTIHSDIGGGNDTTAEQIEADSTPYFRLQPDGDGLHIEIFVYPFGSEGPATRPGKGGATMMVDLAGKRLQTNRDITLELNRVEQAQQKSGLPLGEEGFDLVLGNAEDALETLLLLQEQADEIIINWPHGEKIEILPQANTSQMRVVSQQQNNWFALDGELKLDENKVLGMGKLLELMEQKQGRFITLDDGKILALSKQLRKRLETISAYSDKGKIHQLAVGVITDATDGMEFIDNNDWQERLELMREAEQLQPEIPSTLQAELRDYQIDGFQWMSRLSHWGAGACLADDMGLGKTLQALTLILTRAYLGPTLILAPTSVCMNWIDEAQRFAPTLIPIQFGSGDRAKILDNASPFQMIVCSYGLLQSEGQRLAEVSWDTIVADEAQAIKNSATKRSKMVMELKANFKVVTTGTPIENHLGELWNLFRFINPGLLGSLERFNNRFATPIEVHRKPEVRQQLRNLIRPFIMRRLKSDVLTELPARTEVTIKVEHSETESLFYEAIRRQAVDKLLGTNTEHAGKQRIQVLAEIMRLRQASCNPRLVEDSSNIGSAKLTAFAEITEELLDNNHKALVFSQFVSHLKLIREHLDQQGISYQYLDGSTTSKKRQQAVEAFQRGEGDLFLISLKAGGFGLNLTAADYVIHMDPWWNPAVEDQASDRAHRMGQTRPVTIYRLVVQNTIEEKILSLHQQKRELANSLLEGDEQGGKLSIDELINLIRDE